MEIKSRNNQNKRQVLLTDPILKDLETLWIKSGVESWDFGFWFRNWLTKQIKNDRKK